MNGYFNNCNMNQMNQNQIYQMNQNQMNQNQMNPMNQNINNQNFQNVNNNFNNQIQNEMRGIQNAYSGFNCSYANTVLQFLCSLSDIRNYFTAQNNINLFQMDQQQKYSLSNELYKFINNIYSGFVGNPINIYTEYGNKANQLQNPDTDKIFAQNPYYFLLYFLIFLHNEINQNFQNFNAINITIEDKKNDGYMYNFYLNFIKPTENSIISNSFHFVRKKVIECSNCKGNFYDYNIIKIFSFDVEKYRNFRDSAIESKRGSKLDLNDCFQCYFGSNTEMCPKCRNQAVKYTKIYEAKKYLIIHLFRNNHPFYDDVDFKFFINISQYFYTNPGAQNFNNHGHYSLKAIICYEQNQTFFVDCRITNTDNVNNAVWKRYRNELVENLGDYWELTHQKEPQILVYELDDNYQNNMNYDDIREKFNTNCFKKMNNMNNQMPNNNMGMNNQMFGNNNLNNQMPNNNMGMNCQMVGNNNMINCLINNMNNIAMNNIMYAKMNENIYYNNSVIQQNNNNSNNSQKINDNPGFLLKFIIDAENGDRKENENNTILVQVKNDDTVKKVISKFMQKLLKVENTIEKFIFNDQILEKDDEAKLSDKNINENSTIYAIKSKFFIDNNVNNKNVNNINKNIEENKINKNIEENKINKNIKENKINKNIKENKINKNIKENKIGKNRKIVSVKKTNRINDFNRNIKRNKFNNNKIINNVNNYIYNNSINNNNNNNNINNNSNNKINNNNSNNNIDNNNSNNNVNNEINNE